ncbi:hypothetical protein V8E54_003845 [Elaphomyces granulatus]
MQQFITPSAFEYQDTCQREDVELLFRVGGYSHISSNILRVIYDSPPPDGTENSFIFFWDQNVRRFLELLIPNGKSIRDSSEHTATGDLRPDYGFLLNNLCAFRGEEKAPGNRIDPKKELSDKLQWAYDPAPYVFGYYATGSDLTLVAISPPSRPGERPVVHDIARANLRLRRDRIRNMRRLINISGLFQVLSDIVRPPDAEFVKLGRDNSTVEIAGRCIVKVYTSKDKYERLAYLQKVYNLLEDKAVPNVDTLVHISDTTIVLSPRGVAQLPRTEEELISAVICVLQALNVLHKEPQVFHRDIRWPNVIKSLENPQNWFLIDWEDAAAPPTIAPSHFSRKTHSPKVFTDGHGAEVDIWGVGELIVRCGILGLSLELLDLGKWMQGEKAPTSGEALAKMKEYRSSRHSQTTSDFSSAGQKRKRDSE